MERLIEALQIFLKYKNEEYPTNCSHDTFAVCGIDKQEVSSDDLAKLDDLGFFWSDEEDCFISFEFGSC